MDKNTVILMVAALALLAALPAFAYYKWTQRRRVRQVATSVTDYLVARYGVLPNKLDINCSNDPRWPVLVAFDTPGIGTRHSLQFTCSGPHVSLHSEP